MQLDASLSWLALALTPGLASRLSARVLRKFGWPEGIFRAPLTALESCHLPAPVAQAIAKKESFKRAEKELDGIRKIASCSLLNWTEPEYPQNLLQIYVRRFFFTYAAIRRFSISPASALSARGARRCTERKWHNASAVNSPRGAWW
jgi:predicted Rossmann fold nucleotide-binding protein DprA/Smf involved in DNA uptake